MSRQISLRLPESLAKLLDQRARQQKVPRSELIRAILEAALTGETSTQSRPYDRVKDLIGSLSGGPVDLGARHRKYLADLGSAG